MLFSLSLSGDDNTSVTTPLTTLGDDERLFRDTVREFAHREIRPQIREMDAAASMPRQLIDRLFELGVMAIEVPEELGGSGGTFFHAVVAVEEISAVELNARRLRGDPIQIIDVREPHEFEIARIPGTRLIPLGHVVSRMNEIDPEVETIVHCKGGVRSAKAIEALKRAGFSGRLINLKGGITAWSEDVDPRVAKY